MHRAAVIAIGVVIAVVCIVALVLGLYFGLRTDDNPNNILQGSFSATLDIDRVDYKDLGSKSVTLRVEWNPDTTQLNFQQLEAISPNFGLDFQQEFIVADDKATVGVSNTNTSLNFCMKDISLSQWYGVFQHMLTVDDWISGSKSDGCPGNVWSTKNQNDQTIELCISGNKIQYVIYRENRAIVSSWTESFKDNINITADVMNGPCPSVITIRRNCTKTSDLPKATRDAGTSARTCLFLHGTGETPPTNVVRQDLTDYWGKVKSYTFNCVSHKFLHYDSNSNGWSDDVVQQFFCDAAAVNGTIRNTVLFSHSMGNLVIAAALHSNKCTFDQTSSQWFSSQGPWKGSVAANTISEICRTPRFYEKPIRDALRWYGYCKPNENAELNAHATLKTNYVSPAGVSFNDLQIIGRRYISGVICGTSSTGQLQSIFESFGLFVIQYYATLEHPNDGMVSFESCKLRTDVDFQDRSSSAYYKGKFNHADGTCRNGGCPCKWYEYMH
ncbi:uncharacterized protein [Argopecten irradians]|uniref:uncharacterized protein n=1 Tax=Argopecten irradians TaxID=31199 RepID=UPI0037201C67